MIPELGQFALALALCLAVVQTVLSLAGAMRGRSRWMQAGRQAALAQAVMLSLAFVCLAVSLAENDFSVLYVAANSNVDLPLPYRVAAAWGAHEGSLLTWTLMLAWWGAGVAAFTRSLPQDFAARVVAVMGGIGCGFLLLLSWLSNPFARLLPAAEAGRDLNPLLQDPGMVFHPPLLYLGYVGFSVAFAFALAALLHGQVEAGWTRWVRPWTTAAWCFLTLGILLGSFWAYYELGWGGWWFWDPVENASFMPWLTGTALLHSLAVTEKRGAFRQWTLLLAVLTFSLSLLGTFLVRSGVLTSVHAFAADPERGRFILAFLAFVVGGSLLLYAWRAPRLATQTAFEFVSRETALMVNNLLLVCAAATVLLGTLYPLVIDAMGATKISVGPPYFETTFLPFAWGLLLLLGVGQRLAWQRVQAGLFGPLRLSLILALAVGLFASLALASSPTAAIGFALATWVAASTVGMVVERLWAPRGVAAVAAQGASGAQVGSSGRGQGGRGQGRRGDLAFWGMACAHLGVALFAAGSTASASFGQESEVMLQPGQSARLGDLEFRLLELKGVRGANYMAIRGEIEVVRGSERLALLAPEKRQYASQESPLTEAAISRGPLRDVYVALGTGAGPRAPWQVRLQIKPGMSAIWSACLLMALGGALALTGRLLQQRQRRPSTQSVNAPAALT